MRGLKLYCHPGRDQVLPSHPRTSAWIETHSRGIKYPPVSRRTLARVRGLKHTVGVINTTSDITLSPKKHKDSDVLIFKKDINGKLQFLAEVHIKNDRLFVCI